MESPWPIEIFKVVAQFISVGLVASYITFSYQKRNWKQNAKTQQVSSNIKRSYETLLLVSNNLDRRIYATNYFISSVKNGDSALIKERRDEYLVVNKLWNANINFCLASLELDFSVEIRNEFDFVIGFELVRIGRKILDISRSEFLQIGDVDDLDKATTKIRLLVYDFNVRMMCTLREREKQLLDSLN